MTKDFAVYDPDTGLIKQLVQCVAEFMLCGPGEKFIEVPSQTDPGLWYVQHGKLVKRPVMSAVQVGTVISGVPKGAQVLIEGQRYTADGSPIELEFPLPGTYRIHVQCWPYLDWETTYEA